MGMTNPNIEEFSLGIHIEPRDSLPQNIPMRVSCILGCHLPTVRLMSISGIRSISKEILSIGPRSPWLNNVCKIRRNYHSHSHMSYPTWLISVNVQIEPLSIDFTSAHLQHKWQSVISSHLETYQERSHLYSTSRVAGQIPDWECVLPPIAP